MSRNTARTPLLSGPGDRMLPEISEASGEGGATNSLEEGKVDVEGSELSMHDNTSASEPTKNKLGTLNGVFIPCCLNIMGIILFADDNPELILRFNVAKDRTGW